MSLNFRQKEQLVLARNESHKVLHNYYRLEYNEKKKVYGQMRCLDHYLNTGMREEKHVTNVRPDLVNFVRMS